MNPWDLSCRPKLPQRALNPFNDHHDDHQKWPIAHQPAPALSIDTSSFPAKMCLIAGFKRMSALTNTNAPRLVPFSPTAAIPIQISSSPLSKTPSSVSSSPSSSRSNSIEVNDDIRLNSLLFAEDLSNATSRQALISTDEQIDSDEANCVPGPRQDTRVVMEPQSSPDFSQESPTMDRRARKKDQNRRAAFNYRRKKMEEKNRMREEEMRLVYSRVCLVGYAEQLEGAIMYILNNKTTKVMDNDGKPICFLCPICLETCDNTCNLRKHLSVSHYPRSC